MGQFALVPDVEVPHSVLFQFWNERIGSMRPPTPKEMAQLTTTSMAVLEKVLGKTLLKQSLATMSNGSAWLRARQTTIETLKDIFAKAKPVDDREIEEFAEPRMQRFNDIVGRCLAANPILRARTPASLMRFLVQYTDHVDVAEVERLKFEGLFDVLVPTEVVPPMILDPGNLFEPSVREAGRLLRDSIERWYKALVIWLVNLTCVARQIRLPADLGNRSTLGQWIGAARRLWKSAGGPESVLDADLLQLRNFFSHEELRLDVRAETVVSPLDDNKILTRDEFALLVYAHYFKMTSMWVVLLAWTHHQRTNDRDTASGSVFDVGGL